APCNDDSKTRRNELPSVMPNPRSKGSHTKRPYVEDSDSCSTVKVFGRIRSRQLRATICEVLMPSLSSRAGRPNTATPLFYDSVFPQARYGGAFAHRNLA